MLTAYYLTPQEIGAIEYAMGQVALGADCSDLGSAANALLDALEAAGFHTPCRSVATGEVCSGDCRICPAAGHSELHEVMNIVDDEWEPPF